MEIRQISIANQRDKMRRSLFLGTMKIHHFLSQFYFVIATTQQQQQPVISGVLAREREENT
jgi:hypothetical protein